MSVIQEDISVAIDKILLATDFTVASAMAASYAKALTKRFSSVVEIAHIFDASEVFSEEEALLSPPDQFRRQNREDCLKLLKAECVNSGIKTQALFPEGHDAANMLLKIATTDHVDLIVVGTRYKKGFERLVLGSTAESILRSAACLVLTLSPKSEALKGPLAFNSLIFATDFSVQSAKAAASALSFAVDSGAHLYFCHVVAAYPGSQREAQIMDSLFEEALRKMIPESSYDWCSPECVVEHGEASQAILQLAGRVHADLIILGARKASFLLEHVERGLTPSLLAEAKCPVLTVC